MILWFLITEMISQTDKSMAQLVGERMAVFPCCGEIVAAC